MSPDIFTQAKQAFHDDDAPRLRELLHDADYQSTPLGWAIYGSEQGCSRDSGDFPGTVRALLAAGAQQPQQIAGSPQVREVLARHNPEPNSPIARR